MEINQAAEVIRGVIAEDAEIVFGAAVDPELGDEVKVTVIATGFDAARRSAATSAGDAYGLPSGAQYDAVEDTGGLHPIRPDVIPALDTELPTFLRRSVTAR